MTKTVFGQQGGCCVRYSTQLVSGPTSVHRAISVLPIPISSSSTLVCPFYLACERALVDYVSITLTQPPTTPRGPPSALSDRRRRSTVRDGQPSLPHILQSTTCIKRFPQLKDLRVDHGLPHVCSGIRIALSAIYSDQCFNRDYSDNLTPFGS